MCAYTAKNGKRFENPEIGRTYDRSRGHEPKAEKKTKAKSEPASDKERAGEEEPIEDVVKAHGPAHSTKIEKMDGEEEQYSVHSEHEDGHKHSSHGHSLHEAHAHSMMAHGGEGMDEEEPEGDGENEAQAMPMHSSPPGMPAME
jgi:hypothetical protein